LIVKKQGFGEVAKLNPFPTREAVMRYAEGGVLFSRSE
jgi:hypothetical protein